MARVALLCLLAVLTASRYASAADPLASIPLRVAHEGRLLDAADQPLEGEFDFTFRLYAEPAGGAPIWTAEYPDVPVKQGLYAVELGALDAAPLTLAHFDGNGSRYLAVSIEGSAEFEPRVRLGSVPYAYIAQRALAADVATRALSADDALLLEGKSASFFSDAANLTGTLPREVLPLVTTSAPGAMNAADKTKLDGLTQGITSVTGGGNGLTATTAGTVTTLSLALATNSTPGAMSAADKTKLSSLTQGLTNVTGGGNGLSVAIAGSTAMLSLSLATQTSHGAMSSGDKVKLDGLSQGITLITANSNGLTASTSGYTTTLSLALATPTAPGAMSAADKTKLSNLTQGITSISASGNGLTATTSGTVTTLSLAAATTSTGGAMSAADKTLVSKLRINGDVFETNTSSGWGYPGLPVLGSCKEILARAPGLGSGIYRIKPAGQNDTVAVYCDMVTDGGGWTLIANRRAGYYNIEECGTTIAGFFQNGCGLAEHIVRFKSFALSATVRNLLNHTEMLVVQFDGNGTPDLDDAYIVSYPQNTNLFPNNTAAIVDIPLSSARALVGGAVDTTSVLWRYVGSYHFSSAYCNGARNTQNGYYGGYGLCHNGNGAYLVNTFVGNRNGYGEMKLAGQDNAEGFSERLYVR